MAATDAEDGYSHLRMCVSYTKRKRWVVWCHCRCLVGVHTGVGGGREPVIQQPVFADLVGGGGGGHGFGLADQSSPSSFLKG